MLLLRQCVAVVLLHLLVHLLLRLLLLLLSPCCLHLLRCTRCLLLLLQERQ